MPKCNSNQIEFCTQRFNSIDKQLSELDIKLDLMGENHINHIREELAVAKEKIKQLESKISSITGNGLGKREYGVIAGLISIITTIIVLISKLI